MWAQFASFGVRRAWFSRSTDIERPVPCFIDYLLNRFKAKAAFAGSRKRSGNRGCDRDAYPMISWRPFRENDQLRPVSTIKRRKVFDRAMMLMRGTVMLVRGTVRFVVQPMGFEGWSGDVVGRLGGDVSSEPWRRSAAGSRWSNARPLIQAPRRRRRA